jgi:NDP-4-keto-2,6-dideoxyhexose 3-C-methyltransferase
MYTQITQCRICGNSQLTPVLDLGTQVLTGVFPATRGQAITAGPLVLVKCTGTESVCGLLQLQHSYDLNEMYGLNYGYRSGLNASMVEHLHGKVAKILARMRLQGDPLIIDIGSNDSTTLQAYPREGCTLVGIDPTGVKFHAYYPPHIQLVPEFFSAQAVRQKFGSRKALIVTSFSMFYDLENPLQFMREIHEVLDEQGIWVFEQSYMPTMLRKNSYDTVCHEHLEYYALRQVQWMAERVGLKIVDVEFNDVNGGSFSITAAKKQSAHAQSPQVEAILQSERDQQLDGLAPYREFARRVAESRDAVRSFVSAARSSGKTIAALGASTKGNVILQYCGLTQNDMSQIGEVNSEKFGRYSPGSLIPIVPQEQLLASDPDYLLVLPWHFRKFFEEGAAFAGRSLVFPLPQLTVVRAGPGQPPAK